LLVQQTSLPSSEDPRTIEIMQQHSWDVIIAGGGSAGLSAALMLGRMRRRVLVVDAGEPRNRFAGHMHGVLGRDHTSPLDLLAAGRAELGRYETVTIRSGEVAEASTREGGGFLVTLADGERHEAKRMLLATGLRDELPDVPGLAEQWGRGAFLCPYCDGWEQRDRRIAIIATTPLYVHAAQMLRQLSADVTFFPHGIELAPEAREGLVARGITVEDRAIESLTTSADGDGERMLRGIRLTDGTEVPADVIFVSPTPVPNDGALRALGAEFTTGPDGVEWVQVDPMGRTSVPGVWAAGNLTDGRSSVPYAMSAGSMAGGAINGDLIEGEVRAAVAGR
jgi:thioredoxin reductase